MLVIKRFSHRHSIHVFSLNSTQNKIKKYKNDLLNNIISNDNPLNECVSSRIKNINSFDIKNYENPLNECEYSNIKMSIIKTHSDNPLNECEKTIK